MPDWTGFTDHMPPLPGPFEPAPNPLDPGWSRFLRQKVPPTHDDGLPPSPDAHLTGVAIKVIYKKRVKIAVSGANPSDWFADKKIEVGTGTSYKDFRRYRRVYPQITYQWFNEYIIEVFASYTGDLTVSIGVFAFWVPIAGRPPVPLRNFVTTRWIQSSRYIELPDGGAGTSEDLTPPRSWNNIKSPYSSDLDEPTDIPPPNVLPRRRKPRRVSMVDPFDELREAVAAVKGVAVAYPVNAEDVGEAYWADSKQLKKAGWKI